MAMAKRLRISKGGQVSVPATVRKRWGTSTVLAEDLGDHLVLRPAPDDPIAAAAGALAEYVRRVPTEVARRRMRDEETEIEERKQRRHAR